MGSLLKVNGDVFVVHQNRGGGLDGVPENVTGFGPLIAVTDLGAEQPVRVFSGRRESGSAALGSLELIKATPGSFRWQVSI